MSVIVPCKSEKDPIKNGKENLVTPFSPLKSMGAIGCHGSHNFGQAHHKT